MTRSAGLLIADGLTGYTVEISPVLAMSGWMTGLAGGGEVPMTGDCI